MSKSFSSIEDLVNQLEHDCVLHSAEKITMLNKYHAELTELVSTTIMHADELRKMVRDMELIKRSIDRISVCK